MTFVAAVTAIAERFLTERSFELIVTPAIADFEYDVAEPGHKPFGAHLAVLAALAGAFRDDAVRGGDVRTFVGLVAIPICYYTFFFILGLPSGMGAVPSDLLTVLAVAVITLSLGPVLVCYWPDRQPRDTSTEP